MAGTDRQSCEDCKEAFVRNNKSTPWDRNPVVKKKPPCETCQPPLSSLNALLIKSYLQCNDQWLIAPSGQILGLRNSGLELHLALWQKRYPGNIDWLRFINDLQTVARIVATELNKKNHP